MVEHINSEYEAIVAIFKMDRHWYKLPWYVVVELEEEKWSTKEKWEEKFEKKTNPEWNEYRSFYHWLDVHHDFFNPCRWSPEERRVNKPLRDIKEFIQEFKHKIKAYQINFS